MKFFSWERRIEWRVKKGPRNGRGGFFFTVSSNRLARYETLSAMWLRNASLKTGCYAFRFGCQHTHNEQVMLQAGHFMFSRPVTVDDKCILSNGYYKSGIVNVLLNCEPKAKAYSIVSTCSSAPVVSCISSPSR
jgi:hypothetical protein